MQMSSWLAHISDDRQRTQTVLSHLQGTARLAKTFASLFGGEAQAELAGLAHDIGKYSLAFQKRLMGDTTPVDHSTAGAIECWNIGQVHAAFVVAGHHGGLPNGGNQVDGMEQSTLLGRIKRGEKLEDYSNWKEEVILPKVEIPDFILNKMNREDGMFFTRMLFSCLVDADYLDTETFMDGQARVYDAVSMEQLWDRLQKYINEWSPPKGKLNQYRWDILENCIQEGERQDPGLFSLTVPTGGGKTVSSLAFALAHAKKHGLRRVIYVIPYTSIIEQTADVFRRILGPDNVLEDHSNVFYDLDEEMNSYTIHLASSAENWDMPVVVTTAVQFFESLYAYRPSECRKLHNIAGSVVIFDEVQTIPISYLRPCLHAISQLVEHYNVSAVLCTATQPALESIFHSFLPEHKIRELCPEEFYEEETFRRVIYLNEGRLSWDQLADKLNQYDQVLCIVNTRKAAQEVYRRLDSKVSFHLSTLMCPNHRKEQLVEIRRRLKQGIPCRVVSTSLIEAGVDVDFPAVFREVAGLDSILQAAGRCNREGKRPVEESVVTIFSGEENCNPPLISTAISLAHNKVIERGKNIASLETIQDYFSELRDLMGEDAQDSKKILPLIQKEFFPFRTVSERFCLIDSPTRTIYIPFGDALDYVKQLRSGLGNRRLFRQLGQYGVSVYETHFNALEAAGDLEVLENGVAILRNMALYSNKTGLSLMADSGESLFV